MDYEKVIEELQGGQVDLKRLISIMSANYIALCQSTEKLKKANEQNKKEHEEFCKKHEDFCRTFLELQIQQKIIVEENNYILIVTLVIYENWYNK
ncbi:MAG TPA: hypothetical protein PL110_01115 [Candidatus Eremiobacteraeota bacterium]|mgnify:CR=1 FL=1|nr:MAG: hypothetical protein BWY64_02724 [bacterium ADurb.Bin363]HPZ06686.1 hypothetical protein [Candidatus Eremiobacteraeota bacterium]